MMVSYKMHRNWCGTAGKITTSCFSPPFQHRFLRAEMKGNAFFSSQQYEIIFQKTILAQIALSRVIKLHLVQHTIHRRGRPNCTLTAG